jgi:hypothetical protein
MSKSGPKNTTTSTVNQPTWLQNDWQNLAQTAIGQSSNTGVPQQGTAAVSPGITGAASTSQQFANGALPQISNDVTGANNTLKNLSTSSFTAPGVAASYMNPYEQNVLQTQENLNNAQEGQQLSGIDSAAASSGALGGDRAAVQKGVLQSQDNLNNQNMVAQGLNNAYQTGANQFNADRSTNLSSSLGIGQNDATLANTTGSVLNNESGLGQAAQGAQQNNLNIDYNNELQKILFPEQQTQYQAGILGNVSPNFTGTTQTQQTTNSTLNTILGGIMGLAGGVAKGFGV